MCSGTFIQSRLIFLSLGLSLLNYISVPGGYFSDLDRQLLIFLETTTDISLSIPKQMSKDKHKKENEG